MVSRLNVTEVTYLPLTVEFRVRQNGCHYGSAVSRRVTVHGPDDLQIECCQITHPTKHCVT